MGELRRDIEPEVNEEVEAGAAEGARDAGDCGVEEEIGESQGIGHEERAPGEAHVVEAGRQQSAGQRGWLRTPARERSPDDRRISADALRRDQKWRKIIRKRELPPSIFGQMPKISSTRNSNRSKRLFHD
jgi:hypothetical protein